MSTAAAAQLERWQRFRTNRNKALATRHGWLTLTSFQWLESRPAGVDLAPGMRWTVREILATTDGTAFHTTGTVTFRASFKGGSLHERSRFERVDGAWVYVDGEFPDA